MANRIFTFTLENKARISISAEDIFKAIRQVPKEFHSDIVKLTVTRPAAGHKKALDVLSAKEKQLCMN
jgi:hypothetical protein